MHHILKDQLEEQENPPTEASHSVRTELDMLVNVTGVAKTNVKLQDDEVIPKAVEAEHLQRLAHLDILDGLPPATVASETRTGLPQAMSTDDAASHVFNVMFLGNSFVGKSSLMIR